MILAIDSSAGTAVAVTTSDGVQVSVAETLDRRSHAEAIGPLIAQALDSAGIGPKDITAVVMGVGPGPFTGLRVGMAAAQSFAWARSVPLWPVHSHDAAAVSIVHDSAVITDARRGEWAFSAYTPHPQGGLGVREGLSRLIPREDIDDSQTHWHDSLLIRAENVNPAHLALAAVTLQARGENLEEPRPVYLREPDVTMPQ
ncbi:tRNA threonylcarbamoyl adenosine modification protein TsaB [Pontimonas salivibrio]|uniref:tRNA threonylcarbamoyl adenosine modification protein TsaB n=1 Tax=Pontimonas salivibrio TaxID=1159327 RepID=A0A2L2BNU9_9MICO|nr:tRNA (adenosine(37)-N6)-threonylcarbamoyltransferase complex dimerization subunit type 1 TsaB [Pontimonas salivibrio]AVG23346.1 tRNA threonylcarbamoyl adenosine modification protein TsaB [Pontimonas salivibrio]